MSDPFVDPSAPAPVSISPEPAPVPAPTVRPVKRQGKGGTVLLAVAGLVAIAGIAFAAGRLTAPPAAAAGNTGTTNGGGRFGGFPGGSFAPGGGFRNGGGGAGAFGGAIAIHGQVTAVTPTSITVQIASGTSAGTDVTIPLNSQTTFHQATAGSASDVTVGSTVVVQPGTTNFAPGASPNPQASGAPGFGQITFGPATDVTVEGSQSASPTP